MAPAVKAADQADRAVAGMELQADGPHLLRAGEEHRLPVEREEIRALPHPAILVMAGRDHADVAPMEGVLALKEQDRPAPVGAAVADHGVEPVALPPDLGIAEIVGAAALGQHGAVDDRVAVQLFVIDAVADGGALGLEALHLAVAAADIAHAGIEQQVPPVGQLHCAAGEAAVLIVVGIRRQRRGQTLPVDEVLRLDVTPVHGAPAGVIGVILEKQMVLPFIGRKAVGVVDPADAAGHVELRQFILGIGKVFFFEIAGPLQFFTNHI